MRTYGREYHGDNCICQQCIDVRTQNADVDKLVAMLREDEDSGTDVLTNLRHAFEQAGFDRRQFYVSLERSLSHFIAEGGKI